MQELCTHQLSVEYDQRLLWRDLSFKVCTGEALQIQGANGSGKTTLLKILTGRLWPNAGHVSWCGHRIDDVQNEYHQQLLYLGHTLALKPSLSVWDNLVLLTSFFTTPDPELMQEALEQLGLHSFKETPVKQLSAGLQRRVALLRLLTTPAKLWLLDEPFSAVDAHFSALLQNIMRIHVEQGGILVFTSHTPVDLAPIDIKVLQL